MLISYCLLILIIKSTCQGTRSRSISVDKRQPKLLLICETGLNSQVLKAIIEHLILTGFGTETGYNGWPG